MIWLLLLLQDDPKATVDEMGTHVYFDYQVPAEHIVKWDFWGTEITRFSDGSDLGSKKADESSADSSAFLFSLAGDKRVELVAKKAAKADVTVEGSFDIWVSAGLIEKRIDRLKLEEGELLRLGDYELAITQIVRKDGVVYLRTEFSTLAEINLEFIKSIRFSTTDGTAVKSRDGGRQTSKFKAGKKDRFGYILRWELTTDETEVAVDYVLYDKVERKRFPFKVTAPLSGK